MNIIQLPVSLFLIVKVFYTDGVKCMFAFSLRDAYNFCFMSKITTLLFNMTNLYIPVIILKP